MISARLVSLVLLASSLALAGCARCSGESSGTGVTTAPSSVTLLPPRVPAPLAWPLATVRGPLGVAAPEHCRYRAPLLAAQVPETTHFIADPHTLGLLAVADVEASPFAVVRSGSLVLNGLPSGASMGTAGGASSSSGASSSGAGTGGATDTGAGFWVPWPDPRSAPRLARIGGEWVAAWDVARAGGGSEVVLHRGGAAESLGRGDAFFAADLVCSPSRCALLTSRLGRVAPAGASVVMFDADPQAPLRTVTIEPEGAGSARPFGLASVDGERGPVAVLEGGGEAVFWSIEAPGGPAVLARLPAEHGIVDALLLGGKPFILAHGNVVDDQGCAREGSDVSGAKLRLVREGSPAVEVRTPGAPSLVALRPLAKGALVVWVAPLGCGAERHVTFALVLDENGAPAGAPIPVADSETFAVATSGADVDLWLRHADRVSWLRLTCQAP